MTNIQPQKVARFLLLISSLSTLLAICAEAMIASPTTKGLIFFNPIEGSKPTFHYHRSSSSDGLTTHSKIAYSDNLGKLAAEESISIENGKIKKYLYQQHQIDDAGEAKVSDGKIFLKFTRNGKTIAKTEIIEDEVIAPDMIQEHIQSQWDLLANYKTSKIKLLIIERAETIGFKFYKEKDRDWNGKKVTDIIMQPSNFFISLLVKPARFTFEKDGAHRLLEFQGRLPLRNPHNLDQAIDARIEFDQQKNLQPLAANSSY